MNQVGQAIKKIRQALGWTQEEFAKIMDVPPATVGSWEAGARSPSSENREKLIRTFKVNPQLLYDLAFLEKEKAEV
jgi:DNA-binding transcriptional regulator YiaG